MIFFFLNKLRIILKEKLTAPQAQGVLGETATNLNTTQSDYQQPKKQKQNYITA